MKYMFSFGVKLKKQFSFKTGHWGKFTSFTIAALFVFAMGGLLFLGACGGSSSTTSTGTATVSSEGVDTFAAVGTDVADVTPQVDFTAANAELDDWADWRDATDDDPNDEMTQLAVFEKLLSDSAESVFAPVNFLGELMAIVQAADDSGTGVWDQAGTVTVSITDPETSESADMSITVSLVEDTITFPTFFQDKVPDAVQTTMAAAINRIISFNFSDDTTGWDTVMALGEDDDYYYLIASAAHETLDETQTFVAYMDRSTDTMTLYYASVGADPGGGVYSNWVGNTTGNWFSISQVTGGHNGNQEVVGGGTVGGAGSIAFKSRNNNDDTEDSTDVYYLKDLTVANIEDGTDPGVNPTLGEPTVGAGSIEYLIEGNAKCLGWRGKNESPSARADLAWSPTG
jgi:hypothetical protein